MARRKRRLRESRSIRQKLDEAKTVLAQVAVLVDDVTDGSNADRVWVQVASEGQFDGYMGGEMSFTFDTRLFEQIAANFRIHPSYQKGGDGFGMANVVAWDFHHASEMSPTDGTIPSAGAPAQGWIQDLAVRHNAGKAELWALTKWLEPAKTYIKEGRYQWASVSVVFDAVDAITGDTIGPLLTSVALTNRPFIEGMQKLAAERRLAAERYRNGMYIEAAETPEKALDMIRNQLGLPETTDAAGVVAELEKLKQWALSGQAPIGVDLSEIIGSLRTILNLPSLATTEEVFVEVDKLMARLIEDSGVGLPGSPPPPAPAAPTPEPPPDIAGPSLENRDMELQKALAAKFGVDAKDEAVIEAVDQLLELRAASAANVELDAHSTTKVVLKATLDDAGVRAKYTSILSALGIEDPGAALDKIADLMGESAKLAEMVPEFTALKQTQAELQEKDEEEEVEAAVASAGIAASSPAYEGLKTALLALRKGDPKQFAAKYPKEKLVAARNTMGKTPAQVAALTTMITAGGAKGSPAGGAPGGTGGTGGIDVTAYVGANKQLKTCEFVKATVQGADKWPWAKVCEHASNLVRSGQVTA